MDSNIPIKLGGNKRHAWLFGGFSEHLVLNLKAAKVDSVLREEALHRATAVLNGNLFAVLLVRRALGAVVAVVQVARNVAPRASLRRNPEVRRAGVEDNEERLSSEEKLLERKRKNAIF